MKTFGKGVEDVIQIVALGETVFAGDAVMRATELLVIAQVREAAGLGARANAFGKNASEKERVIADVQAELETGAIVGGLERGDHFEKVIERVVLARKNALSAFRFGKSGKDFGDVIGNAAVGEVGAFEDMANQDVKIKARGNLKAAVMLKERVKQGFIVQNQVTGFLICEQFNETLRRAQFAAQDLEDKFNVLRRKLHAAVGLNQFHRLFSDIRIIFTRNPRTLPLPFWALAECVA